ncbi:MAG: hypothetical protein LBM41_07515 [Ruminococcus sp.]|nr:hypothetical protein [Ruminococcus sp.]
MSSSKKARIGFCLLLGGPAVLLIPTLIDLIVTVPDILAVFFAFTSAILPGIGAIFCIISLVKGKELDKLGRALSIITIVMCNPLFYPLYFVICMNSGDGLAGMSFM